jgi:hypothetical protein
MKTSIALISSSLALTTLLVPAVTHAQSIANDVMRCGEIADDQSRLRCFDALLPDARKSEEQRRAEADAKAKAEFGLSATQRSEAINQEPEEKRRQIRAAQEESSRVNAAIVDLNFSRFGTIFALDNGQVWQTTSFGQLSTVPRIGQKVTVSSTSLGGYRLVLEGKTQEIGVKRIK